LHSDTVNSALVFRWLRRTQLGKRVSAIDPLGASVPIFRGNLLQSQPASAIYGHNQPDERRFAFFLLSGR